MRKISSASRKELFKFIQENVEKGSMIVTDGWQGYNGIENEGYGHEIKEGEDSIEVASQLVHIHRAFSNLKTFINGTYHGVSKKHLQAYLNEYVFRYNRRRVPFESFNALLGIGTMREALTYRGLFEGKWIHPNPKAK